MALCVALATDGTLVPTGEPVESCTGYVLASAAEHATWQVLGDLFVWPAPEVAMEFFLASFGFVLVCNVVGSMVGSVVKMVSTDRA